MRRAFVIACVASALAFACGELLDVTLPVDAGAADAAKGDATNGDGTDGGGDSVSDAAAPTNDAGDAGCTLLPPLEYIDGAIRPPWSAEDKCGSKGSSVGLGCLSLACPVPPPPDRDIYKVVTTPIAASLSPVTLAFDVKLQQQPPVDHTFAQLVSIFAPDPPGDAIGNVGFEYKDAIIRLYDNRAPAITLASIDPGPQPSTGYHIEVTITRADGKATCRVTVMDKSAAFEIERPRETFSLQLGPFLFRGADSGVTNCYSTARRCP